MLVILGLVLLLNACSTSTPTPDMAKVNTMIAQTVAVQQTRTEVARPTSTPTVQPTATNTLQPPAPTVAPTSAQLTITTPTVQPVSGIDGGQWVASNPADQTAQLQGQTFKVNLKLMNTGTSTWTTDYGIRYVSGDITAAVDTYYMTINVPSGAQIEFTVTLTAPSKTGMLRGNWVIFNSAGAAFSNFYFEYNIK